MDQAALVCTNSYDEAVSHRPNILVSRWEEQGHSSNALFMLGPTTKSVKMTGPVKSTNKCQEKMYEIIKRKFLKPPGDLIAQFIWPTLTLLKVTQKICKYSLLYTFLIINIHFICTTGAIMEWSATLFPLSNVNIISLEINICKMVLK